MIEDGLPGYHDDKVRYRAAVRSRNLQRCGESRAGYDILNGHDRPELAVPPQPEPEGALKDHIAQMRIYAENERRAEAVADRRDQ